MNNSVEDFDALDHQYTPEETLHQIGAHKVFTIGVKPLDPVALFSRAQTEFGIYTLFLD